VKCTLSVYHTRKRTPAAQSNICNILTNLSSAITEFVEKCATDDVHVQVEMYKEAVSAIGININMVCDLQGVNKLL